MWWLCRLAWGLSERADMFTGPGADLRGMRDRIIVNLYFVVPGLAAAALAIAVVLKISAYQETARSLAVDPSGGAQSEEEVDPVGHR